MANKEQITKQKIDSVYALVNCDEYKKADALMKRVNKMKDDIKGYCQANQLHELRGEIGRVEYKVRTQKKIDSSLIEEDRLANYQSDYQVWLSYFEKN